MNNLGNSICANIVSSHPKGGGAQDHDPAHQEQVSAPSQGYRIANGPCVNKYINVPTLLEDDLPPL